MEREKDEGKTERDKRWQRRGKAWGLKFYFNLANSPQRALKMKH